MKNRLIFPFKKLPTSNLSLDKNTEYQKTVFRNLNLSKKTLESHTFEHCLFTKCHFNEATLKRCLFEKCLFLDCDFSIASLPETRLVDTIFLRCKLTGIDWSQLNTKMGLKLHILRSDLSYSVFDKIDISQSILRRCKIYEANFIQVTARKCNFRWSDFSRTNFQKCLLIESDFRKAKNYEFNPYENICKDAKFSYPDVLGLLKSFEVVVDDL